MENRGGASIREGLLLERICTTGKNRYNTIIVMQEPLLYLDGSTVFLFAGLQIASKMKASQ